MRHLGLEDKWADNWSRVISLGVATVRERTHGSHDARQQFDMSEPE